MRAIRFVVIHHTARDGSTPASVRLNHIAMGWSDAGYHELVMPDGSWHALRPVARPGAHTKDFNAHTIALAFSGNLDKHPPTPAAYATMLQRAAYHKHAHQLPAEAVVGHRETPALGAAPTKKQCPGRCVDMDVFRGALSFVEEPHA